jgi:DNA-binding NtrC family response regulator
MSVPVLIVNYDSSLRRKMRQSLETFGYSVIEATDAESGLGTLRASADSMVALFNVTLNRNTMTGVDGVAFLGAAACDARLARRHSFIIITPTPGELDAALGKLIKQLSIPILAEPVDMDEMRQLVGEAELRLLVSA